MVENNAEENTKEPSDGDWFGQTDAIILLNVGTDPFQWMRGLWILGFFCVALLFMSYAYETFVADSALVQLVFQFSLFSLLPAFLASYGFLKAKTLERLPIYFACIWVPSIVILVLMNGYIGLSRIDCGLSCVTPFWVDNVSTWAFAIVWVFTPLYFWWKTKFKKK